MCLPWLAIMALYEDYEDLYCLFREMGLTSLLNRAGEKKIQRNSLLTKLLLFIRAVDLKLGV